MAPRLEGEKLSWICHCLACGKLDYKSTTSNLRKQKSCGCQQHAEPRISFTRGEALVTNKLDLDPDQQRFLDLTNRFLKILHEKHYL